MLKQTKKIEHWPTLNTVIMVEKVLSEIDEGVIKLAELKRKLPRQVNHNTLILILRYLEESNKILTTIEGITWIHNTNPNLKRAISKGMEI
jgi:hypothetical protein